MDLGVFVFIFFFKQKTAYEMRISDWSSDVCSSDLARTYPRGGPRRCVQQCGRYLYRADDHIPPRYIRRQGRRHARAAGCSQRTRLESAGRLQHGPKLSRPTQGKSHREFRRSEEHTSELQSLMRISYAVFCLKTAQQHHHVTAKPDPI